MEHSVKEPAGGRVASFATLTDNEEKELYRLHRLHYREARRCEIAKAYLAGCVMLGSALEAMLVLIVLMVKPYPEEAEQTGRIPRYRNRPKALRHWRVEELLRVVKGACWLPFGLSGWMWKRMIGLREKRGLVITPNWCATGHSLTLQRPRICFSSLRFSVRAAPRVW